MTDQEPDAADGDAFQAVFRRALREARAKTTQRAIAHRVHVAESTLAEWKSVPGRKPRTLDVVRSLEAVLRRAGANLAENELIDAWRSDSPVAGPMPSGAPQTSSHADLDRRALIEADVLPVSARNLVQSDANDRLDAVQSRAIDRTHQPTKDGLPLVARLPSRRRGLILAAAVGILAAVFLRLLGTTSADGGTAGTTLAPSAASPSPTVVAVGAVIYKVTNDSGSGASPQQIAPGDAIEQRFVSSLEILTSVSVVIGRDMTPITDADHLLIGRIRIEVTDADGAIVASQEAEALNNVNTTFLLEPAVEGKAHDEYLLRVTNTSSVPLGFYVAPTPRGYMSGVEIRSGEQRPVNVGGSPMSLTAEISAEPR